MDQQHKADAQKSRKPRSERLRDHARKCRDLAHKVIPDEIAERLKAFARIYEARAADLEIHGQQLVEPAHYPAHEGSGGRG